jgi:hypothetical protein
VPVNAVRREYVDLPIPGILRLLDLHIVCTFYVLLQKLWQKKTENRAPRLKSKQGNFFRSKDAK